MKRASTFLGLILVLALTGTVSSAPAGPGDSGEYRDDGSVGGLVGAGARADVHDRLGLP